MFQQVLSPQGTWSSTVQYQYFNVSPVIGVGGGYVAVPVVIYNGATYYATNSFPTINVTPVANPSQWQILSASSTESPNFTGTVTAGTGLVATTGGVTSTNGNVSLGTAGNKITIAEGANGVSGNAVLVAGTVTVATTAVTANSRFSITRTAVNASTALGELVVTKNAGVGFTVTSVQPGTPGSPQTGDLSNLDWSFFN